MTVADNIKIKDFGIISHGAGVYEISYKGVYVHTEFGNAYTAKKWIKEKAKKVNAILEKAREELPL